MRLTAIFFLFTIAVPWVFSLENSPLDPGLVQLEQVIFNWRTRGKIPTLVADILPFPLFFENSFTALLNTLEKQHTENLRPAFLLEFITSDAQLLGLFNSALQKRIGDNILSNTNQNRLAEYQNALMGSLSALLHSLKTRYQRNDDQRSEQEKKLFEHMNSNRSALRMLFQHIDEMLAL